MIRFLKGINRNIILLGWVSFITDTSSEMIKPLLPMFITSLGGAGLAVGLIGGLSESVSSILKVFSGYLSDRWGRKKPFVLSGYLMSALMKLLFPFVLIWQYLLILMPLERVGKGLRTAPRDALIARNVKYEVKGKAFGFHRTMDTSGAILGSLLALIFIWLFSLNIRTIIFIAALVAFLSLIPLAKVKETTGEPHKTSLKVSLTGLPSAFKKYLFVATFFALGNFTYMFFILKASQHFKLRWVLIAPVFLYVLYHISYASLSMPFGILSDKIGRKKVLVLGYLVFGLSCLGFAFFDSLWWLMGLFLLYGLFYALVDGNQRAFATDLSGDEVKATALGAFHTMIGLAALPAGLIAGFLYRINPDYTFLFGASIGIISCILLGFLVKSK